MAHCRCTVYSCLIIPRYKNISCATKFVQALIFFNHCLILVALLRATVHSLTYDVFTIYIYITRNFHQNVNVNLLNHNEK